MQSADTLFTFVCFRNDSLKEPFSSLRSVLMLVCEAAFVGCVSAFCVCVCVSILV